MSDRIHCITEPITDLAGDDLLPGWYFWDETDAFSHGPFNTRGEAEQALATYGEQLNTEDSDD